MERKENREKGKEKRNKENIIVQKTPGNAAYYTSWSLTRNAKG